MINDYGLAPEEQFKLDSLDVHGLIHAHEYDEEGCLINEEY